MKRTLEPICAQVRVCEEKLDRAQKLIGGLGGEKARWTQVAAELGERHTRLVGDMLMAAGFIAYLGVLGDGADAFDYGMQIRKVWSVVALGTGFIALLDGRVR